MQAKEAVEIDDRLGSVARTWNGDARAHSVIRLLAMRHHDVQPIRRTALKEHNKTFIARAGSRFCRINCTRKKAGNNTGSNKSQRAILQKNSASYGHRLPSTKQIQSSDWDERSVIPRTVTEQALSSLASRSEGPCAAFQKHSPRIHLLWNSGDPIINPAMAPRLGGRFGSSNFRCDTCGSFNCLSMTACVCADTSPARISFSSKLRASWPSPGAAPCSNAC